MNWLAPARITAPTDTPVSVAECKAHLAITHSEHDGVIEAFLAAAIAHLDGRTGILNRCMVAQVWRQDFTAWPADGILRLPFCDVTAISSLAYSDEDDASGVISAAHYALQQDALSSFLWLKQGFTAPALNTDRPDPIRVTFTAGYGAAAAVPASLKAAILLMVGDLYENREDTVVGQVQVTALPRGVDALVRPHRRVGF